MQQASLASLLNEAIHRHPEQLAIEFENKDYRWSYVAEVTQCLAQLLQGAGVARFERIGFVAHTRASHVACFWGLLAIERCPSMIFGHQSPEKLAQDIVELHYPVVIADQADWTAATITAARAAGSMALSLSEKGVAVVTELSTIGAQADRRTCPTAAVETLSSGTTGRPKRIQLSQKNLLASAMAAIDSIRQMSGQNLNATPSPHIVMLPLANISGVYACLPAAASATAITLLEKFTVNKWLALVDKHQPATADVPPAAMAMLLQAGVRKEQLSSIRIIRSGAAPLDPEVHRKFSEDFGIPINLSYGASEFCGVITTWTVDDLAEFESNNRGSCGRALPGVELRVVDPDSGSLLGASGSGLLEARVQRMGPEWIRTADIVRIDDDGFMWFLGRNDTVIMRGGFKISPEQLVDVLTQHPSITAAAVIGVKDQRLGEVPVAAVELAEYAKLPAEDELKSFCRERLAAHQVPERFVELSPLPRTSSMKLDLSKIRELLL